MSGMYLNKDESRTVARALQLLERELAGKMEQTMLPTQPVEESLPLSIRSLLDQHDALSAFTVMLSNIGDHWINEHGLELAKRGLERYIDLLKVSIAHDHVPDDEFLIDHDLRLCKVELTRSCALLDRLDPVQTGSQTISPLSMP